MLERGNRDTDNMPDLNLEGQKKYEAMIERNTLYGKKKLISKTDMELKMTN